LGWIQSKLSLLYIAQDTNTLPQLSSAYQFPTADEYDLCSMADAFYHLLKKHALPCLAFWALEMTACIYNTKQREIPKSNLMMSL